MNIIYTFRYTICILSLAACVYAQDANRDILRRKLAAEIEKIAFSHDGVMGVAIKDLISGEEILINDQLTFPTGSSIKIPILIELHKQAAEGKYKLTDQRWVEKKDQVGGSGVIVNFGDHTSQLSLSDLAKLMIALSDNTATNMLIDQVGMANVNRTLDELGLKRIRLRRKMIDQAASARGDENTATPREAMALMEKLYRGQVVSRQLSDDALKFLKIRKDSPIPRLLPASVEIANKPGNIEGAACDWAIVYVPNHPYAIAVMTNYNGADENAANEAIAKVSKLAYDYFARLARSTGYGARAPLELLKHKQ
ncbi:MAG: serine hydrolase, partial [Chloracidobacterium sp.]|nr:serine hydrolase [Chloracidobacterium sp.]